MTHNRRHFVITGGHHNSALVVARQLSSLGHRVTWFGHRFAARGDRQDSVEYLEVTQAQLSFYNLQAAKWQGWLAPRELLYLPMGFWQTLVLLLRLRPDAVLSFGGYLGLTTAFVAFLLRIPVFLHEQTTLAGKANKITALFARRVYLAWKSSRRFFPASKTLFVGLPLRPALLNPRRRRLFPSSSRPTLLIMGGKQGSHTLNNFIFQNLTTLLKSYNIIHQTGLSSQTNDYQQALKLRSLLPTALTSRYQIEPYISESRLGSLLVSCTLYLGRSGAHITYELGLLGVRSVLVPFPHTHAHEQLANARFLRQAGLAVILSQAKLTYPNLQKSLRRALRLPKPTPLALPRDAATRLIADLLYVTSV